MEADKKAQELINKFGLGCLGKKNAIKCCDEIIETCMTGYLLNDQSVSDFQIKMRTYWEQVKNIIKTID